MERFAKYSKFYSIDFFHFFANVENRQRKRPIKRKIGVTRWPFALILFTLLLSARAWFMTWRVNFVRSKGAQKQLARTCILATVTSWKADVSSVSPSLWRRVNVRNVSFSNVSFFVTVANLHFQLRWYNQLNYLVTPADAAPQFL